MTTEGKVSPLPWKYSKDREDVLAADASPVVVSGFRLSGGSGPRSNREFIVRAVNNHDRLVDAIERYVTVSDADSFSGLRAALAAAKEG